ncbi:hypothetical protein KW796_02060 [Candidatus Parcubacteria bacterium]|nr:hypothetical protein [Candidatus Parcubacteria bacterium]
MTTTVSSNGLDAALAVLSRIEALPLVRRRGQPDHHREPLYLGQERYWLEEGIFNEGGSLLLLAAQASLIVSRWELETSFYIAKSNDEWWARVTYSRGFEEIFGKKSHYQLVEVLESVVHEKVDLPTCRELLVPRWKKGSLGDHYLYHEFRYPAFRVRVEVSAATRQHVNMTVEDYGGTQLVSVYASSHGLGSGHYGGAHYEHKHMRAIRYLLELLVKRGMLPGKVMGDEFAHLTSHAKKDSDEWEK